MNRISSKFPNVLLTSLCVLLTLNLVVAAASSSHASEAMGQMNYSSQPSSQSSQPGLMGAAQAAARTADLLVEVNQRLARIEARLDKGFNVKVTEMPPVTVTNSSAPKTADADSNKP